MASMVEGPGSVGGDVGSYEQRPLNPARLRAIELYAGTSILDVGCGNGSYVIALAPQRSIIGVDHQPFPSWRQQPGRFAVSNASHLAAFRSDSVDTVLLFEVLEHLDDPVAVLREAGRIARKNVLLSVPNAELSAGMNGSRLIYYHWIDRTHRHFFDQAALRDLIFRAGLHLDSMETINPITLAPLIVEAFGLERIRGLVERVIRRRQRVAYEMTLLAVASPP